MDRRVHAFTDDALGDDDAVALAERLRRREVAPPELRAAVADHEAAGSTRKEGCASRYARVRESSLGAVRGRGRAGDRSRGDGSRP